MPLQHTVWPVSMRRTAHPPDPESALPHPVSMLITDVDNTLFDWVSMWEAAYTAQLAEVLRISGVAEDELMAEIREVHQRHGTSEYAFLIEELTCLRRPGESREQVLERFRPATDAFVSARDGALHLYPGVQRTLEELRARGVFLAGYTESLAAYSIHRIRSLGLDGVLHVLYTPPNHAMPAKLSEENLRRHPRERSRLRETLHRHTLNGKRKPNPEMLAHIIDSAGGDPEATAYVGDSLLRDVSMAQEAGVSDVLAAYGSTVNGEGRALLNRLTHWTDEQTAQERRYTRRPPVVATYVLRESFAELMDLFDFAALRQG